MITQDFASTSQLSIPGISPAFGDIDSDGDADLLVGNSDGTLSLFANSGSGYALTQAQVVSNTGTIIDVGQFSTPQLFDVNKDGKLDLLVGERSGNLNYYENTGTASAPVYTLASANLGGVLVNNYLNLYGYSYPFMFDSLGVTKLLVGSVTGYIYEYANIDNNLSGTFTLVDSMYYNIYEPQRLTVASADLDGDGIREILAGNYSGGMTLYKYDSTSGVGELQVPVADFNLYPNPASSELIIRFDTQSAQARDIVLYDLSGKELMRKHQSGQVVVLQVDGLASGMYQCMVHESGGTFVKKLIIDHR